MRVFHVGPEQFSELPAPPPALPAQGFLWVGTTRREFEARIAELQAALQAWTGSQLVDLHISDLLNRQLPSHYDYTSWYDVLVFRRLAAGTPTVIYGNVANRGLIDNLPEGCCVEVPCLVDKNGVQPVRVGALPPQLAALMQTNINVQALTVEAALTGKREHVYHAAMLDPHTAAELDLNQIWRLVDDLNRVFRAPVVEARPGGAKGGGAALTPTGRMIVENYRAIEAKAAKAVAKHLHALSSEVSDRRSGA